MSTEITNKPTSLKGLINSENMRNQFALALPKHLTAERFTRVAITALTRTPKLQSCTPESFMRCLLDLSAWGIEPDGRRAHLIPYGTECTLILDYKGIAELVMRSGLVSSIHADKVCENDDFQVDRGKVTKHVIDFRNDRGKPYAYYVLIAFKDGSEKSEVMTRDEVEAIRKRSRAGSSGPWVTDFDEMGKKTVFRRASKWLPLSPEVRDAFDKDADTLAPEPRQVSGRVVSDANPFDKFPDAAPPAIEADAAPIAEAAPEIKPDEQTDNRAAMIEDIKETCTENEITLATFGGKCKSLGIVDAKATLRDVAIETLTTIHSNRLAIIKGGYTP